MGIFSLAERDINDSVHSQLLDVVYFLGSQVFSQLAGISGMRNTFMEKPEGTSFLFFMKFVV